MKTYLLDFVSPVHFSNARPNFYEQSETILRSDTIVAAIISVLANYGTSADKLQQLQENLCLSSAYPYTLKGGRVHYFFPRVQTLLRMGPSIENKTGPFRKQIKNIEWLDQDSFEKQLAGEVLFDDLSALEDWLESNDQLSFFERKVVQRVQVPRTLDSEKKPEPYFFERFFFRENCGLFFIVKDLEETQEKELELALQILQHEGFGTDRRVGNGQFKLRKSKIDLRIKKSPYATNLGLFCPENKTQLDSFLPEEDSSIAFSLIKRGGWMGIDGFLSKHKKSIYMFSEGGVFKTAQQSAGKASIDLSPVESPNPIWRNGKTIFLPITLNYE